MIFNEIYSAYYLAVATLLKDILSGERDEKKLYEKVKEIAFEESPNFVLANLKSGKWQLVDEKFNTKIKNPPNTPLTILQKRWLKSLETDPRIQLFGVSFKGVEGVKPLFTEADYFIYDKYLDGDDYTDEGYIQRFRTLLKAIKEGKAVRLEVRNKNGVYLSEICKPKRLEYSEKDDKFRLLTYGNHFLNTINLAKIKNCEIYEGSIALNEGEQKTHYGRVTLKVIDEKNALERCLLHFAHFEKRSQKIDENTYLLTVKYDKRDETEIEIRVLSFGSCVEVVSPPYFKKLIIKRLKKQMELGKNSKYK